MSPAHQPPSGPAYDIVLVLHIICVLVSLATVVASGVQAARLRGTAGHSVPAGLRTYYRPGTNWAARTLYGVPVFGFLLLGLSGGYFHLADGWVLEGFALWVLAILVAEGALWPAERRIQVALRPGGDGVAASDPADEPPALALAGECRMVSGLAAGLLVVLVLAIVLMTVQP